MEISILFSLARQVEGEWILVNVVQAHKDVNKLREYLAQNDMPRTMSQDGVDYVIEYGVIENIEVKE
jgi:hypothetical protein